MRHERDGEGATDSFEVRLHYFTGLTVDLGANCLSALARPRFHLRGTRGNCWKWGLDPQEAALSTITRIESADWGDEPETAWGTLALDEGGRVDSKKVQPITGDYRAFYTGVRDAILGKGSAPVPMMDAWRTARVLEYAMESAREGRNVECNWSAVPE